MMWFETWRQEDYVKKAFKYQITEVNNTIIISINYNTDTGLNVAFDLFPGRVLTVTSTCTFIRVHNTPRLGTHTHTHTWLLCTPVMEINHRRHLVRYLCCNLSLHNTNTRYWRQLYSVTNHVSTGTMKYPASLSGRSVFTEDTCSRRGGGVSKFYSTIVYNTVFLDPLA